MNSNIVSAENWKVHKSLPSVSRKPYEKSYTMWKVQPGLFIMLPNEREPLLGLSHNQYLAFLCLEFYISGFFLL